MIELILVCVIVHTDFPVYSSPGDEEQTGKMFIATPTTPQSLVSQHLGVWGSCLCLTDRVETPLNLYPNIREVRNKIFSTCERFVTQSLRHSFDHRWAVTEECISMASATLPILNTPYQLLLPLLFSLTCKPLVFLPRRWLQLNLATLPCAKYLGRIISCWELALSSC